MDHFLHRKVPDEDFNWQIKNLDSSDENPLFFDAFRHFHSDRKDAFTCWNTSANCRSTNYGTRIDYILTSDDLKANLVTCDIHPEIMGSDHCPVSATFDFVPVKPEKLPLYCTKNFPEFSGNQQKLSAYFKTNPEKRKLDQQTEKSAAKKKVIQQSKIGNFFLKK